MSDTLERSVRDAAAAWLPLNERDLRAQADADRALAEDGAASLQKSGAPTHFTASVFLFDRALEWVALCYHRKGQFWVQPGGHLEAEDSSVQGAALRELCEETGVTADAVDLLGVCDLDSHALNGGFGACARHLDFGVAARLRADQLPELRVSDESEDLRWARVDELPAECAPGLPQRIALMRDRVRLRA